MNKRCLSSFAAHFSLSLLIFTLHCGWLFWGFEQDAERYDGEEQFSDNSYYR
jgi:hypothetical protein